MSIRTLARLWYETKYGKAIDSTYSSKYYLPEESWPKKSVWWFQIPINVTEKNQSDHINLLCQVSPNENNFHYLKVPTKFFRENLAKFHFVDDKISIYLSTDTKRLFVEERGEGNLDFQIFLVNK
jgi:hypothetical protein